MKLLLSTLFIAATIGFAPSAFAVDNSIQPLCADGSAYSRPGGYCDQVASNKSLVATGNGWRAAFCADNPCSQIFKD